MADGLGVVFFVLAVAALLLAAWENIEWRSALHRWGQALDREKILRDGLMEIAHGVDETWAYQSATRTMKQLTYEEVQG